MVYGNVIKFIVLLDDRGFAWNIKEGAWTKRKGKREPCMAKLRCVLLP